MFKIKSKKFISFILTFVITVCLTLFSILLSSCESATENSESVSETSELMESDISLESSVLQDDESYISNEESNILDNVPEFEKKEYKAPDNVIYNSNKTEHYGPYICVFEYDSPPHQLWYAFDASLSENALIEPCELEQLVEAHKGDDETWFYVAFNVNSYERGVEYFPTNEIAVEESRDAVEYLRTLGFIPDFDHIWSYTEYLKGNREYTNYFSVVGYMTADMISEVEKDEDMLYVIMHLPSNDNLKDFGSCTEDERIQYRWHPDYYFWKNKEAFFQRTPYWE